MSNNLVTAKQLETAMTKIKDLLSEKLTANKPISVSGIDVDGAFTISYSRDGNSVVLTATDGGAISLPFPDIGQVEYAKLDDSTQTITAGAVVADGLGVNNGTVVVPYSFPDSSTFARMKSLSATGGGMVLTTKHRSFMLVSYTGDTIGADGVADVYANHYTMLRNATAFTLNLVPASSGFIDEYWIDLEFPDGSEPEVAFESREELNWPQDEPEWRSCAGYRIQIHIMAGVATYSKFIPNNE